MIREIDFMIGLESHPHLLCFLGCSKDPENPMILTELCEKGDLLTLLRNAKDYDNGLTKSDLLPIGWQISDALLYLSGKKMIHRDVAVRNVLITGQNLAKLADFGLCRESNSLFYTSRGGRLPIKWMAPESLKTAEFTEKTDVWSFGVLLWELYTFGNSPFVSIDAEDVFEYIKKGNRLEMPEDAPELIKALSSQCWSFDPSDRPNFDEIRSLLYKSLEIEASDGYLDFRRNRIEDTVSITSEVIDGVNEKEMLQELSEEEIYGYGTKRIVTVVTIEQENEVELEDDERYGEGEEEDEEMKAFDEEKRSELRIEGRSITDEEDEKNEEEIFKASESRIEGARPSTDEDEKIDDETFKASELRIENTGSNKENDKNDEAPESIKQMATLKDEETQKDHFETPIYS